MQDEKAKEKFLKDNLFSLHWCEKSYSEPLFFAESSLPKIGKSIQNWMINKAKNYSCDGCHYCCYGYEGSKEWCTTEERSLDKRDPFIYWSGIFERYSDNDDRNVIIYQVCFDDSTDVSDVFTMSTGKEMWNLQNLCKNAKDLKHFLEDGIIYFDEQQQ